MAEPEANSVQAMKNHALLSTIHKRPELAEK